MASFSASDERRRAIPDYRLPEHRRIAQVLRMLKSDLLTSAGCFFGRGTAIVMKLGEYRTSLDIDFLCSSQEGYRTLRQAVTAKGCEGVFEESITQIRDFRCDQYELRTAIVFDGQPIKLEIVREGRIDVTGAYDPVLGCPLLSLDDQFAEKLLANSDRGKDRSACYRDALDLGMLILAHGDRIPDAAAAKAEAAYGSDVWRDARWVVDHVEERPGDLAEAAATLRMDLELARRAMSAVARESRRGGPPGSDVGTPEPVSTATAPRPKAPTRAPPARRAEAKPRSSQER